MFIRAYAPRYSNSSVHVDSNVAPLLRGRTFFRNFYANGPVKVLRENGVPLREPKVIEFAKDVKELS